MIGCKNIFIFGYGYTAAALTRVLLREGWKVAATSRSEVKRQELERLNVTAYRFPDARITADLANFSHLLISIPPGHQGDRVLAKYLHAIRAHSWRWVGLLSSAGVCGNHQGAWVGETTALPADTKASLQSRIDAERSWMNLFEQHHLPVHIFRPGEICSSLIPVEDIVHAIIASLSQPQPGTIYSHLT